ncbi:hypothetical protein [Rathayibacter agropyri]|uniref:hypothetical protein n=1 Tax=Rathayibacter agropyri TaxID=1634927 RepID=UPI001563BC6A|nr:hypothetical protein [Rathayibacter agropyri]NRD08417.1 hypothetical protein [Rathayibacter agropyri]
MKVRADFDAGWVDAADDLDSLPEWLLMLDDGTVVFIEKVSSVQWSICRTAPDLDRIGPDGGYPIAGRVAYLNRRPDGGWVARMEEDGSLISKPQARIEAVVSDLLSPPRAPSL